MKLRSQKTVALILAGFTAVAAIAQETKPAAKLPEPPDKEKLSYALGMSLGAQIKRTGVDADVKIIAQGIKDVLTGMPTEVQESELRGILNQAEISGHLKQTSKNIAEGETFLAKNAKADGITVLPDGLQYKVIKTGTGDAPKRIDILTLNFRGTYIDGTEFRKNEHLEIPFFGCTKGLQEALLLMKVGSKWQIFVPYTLAYGRVGERATGFGSTLVYELELVATEPETARRKHPSAGQAGHSLDEDLLPPKVSASVIKH